MGRGTYLGPSTIIGWNSPLLGRSEPKPSKPKKRKKYKKPLSKEEQDRRAQARKKAREAQARKRRAVKSPSTRAEAQARGLTRVQWAAKASAEVSVLVKKLLSARNNVRDLESRLAQARARLVAARTVTQERRP